MPTPSPTDASSLARMVEEARRAWPDLAVDDAAFAAHLATKLGGSAAGAVRLADLYLAFACSRRDERAIARFEAAYFGEIDAARSRFSDLPLTADDVVQRVRQRLFLDDPPSLAGYSGHGDLRAWFRAAILHMLINIATRETRERPTEDGFFDAVVDGGVDAEAAYLKQACRAEFEEAFAAALARLDARERMMLKYAFADGLSASEIASIFTVHKATAARWVSDARSRLVAETRADLMTRLNVDENDAESILRAALSRMGTSLLRRFG